jgi:cytochrome d ubiquinol oxidase subunit II
MTVTQAAAGRPTLVALIIAVVCGSAILVPALALLFTLFLRGQLDTLESHATGEAFVPPVASVGEAVTSAPGAGGALQSAAVRQRGTARGPRGTARRWGGAAVVGLVAGTGLLVFTVAAWAHVLGVAGLVLCAVAMFALTATPLDR